MVSATLWCFFSHIRFNLKRLLEACHWKCAIGLCPWCLFNRLFERGERATGTQWVFDQCLSQSLGIKDLRFRLDPCCYSRLRPRNGSIHLSDGLMTSHQIKMHQFGERFEKMPHWTVRMNLVSHKQMSRTSSLPRIDEERVQSGDDGVLKVEDTFLNQESMNTNDLAMVMKQHMAEMREQYAKQVERSEELARENHMVRESYSKMEYRLRDLEQDVTLLTRRKDAALSQVRELEDTNQKLVLRDTQREQEFIKLRKLVSELVHGDSLETSASLKVSSYSESKGKQLNAGSASLRMNPPGLLSMSMTPPRRESLLGSSFNDADFWKFSPDSPGERELEHVGNRLLHDLEMKPSPSKIVPGSSYCDRVRSQAIQVPSAKPVSRSLGSRSANGSWDAFMPYEMTMSSSSPAKEGKNVQEDAERVCKYYMEGDCRHKRLFGTECPFQHPYITECPYCDEPLNGKYSHVKKCFKQRRKGSRS